MVVSPEPRIKRAESVPASRTLAYQDKIVRAAEAPSEVAPQKQAAPAAERPGSSHAGPGSFGSGP